MAAWDDILRASLKAAGKAADEIEEVIAKVAKAVDGGASKADDAAKTAAKKEPSAFELAKMSSKERSAYNASKNAENKIASADAAARKKAEEKLANVTETEDIINKTMNETMKTKFGQAGLASQINKMYGSGFDVSENAIIKRVEDAVLKAVKEAQDAGTPLSREQVKSLISSKTSEITEQMTKAAETAQKSTKTRVENISKLTPEEARMSGVKTALVSQKAKAERLGESESFLEKLTRMAKDENLLPILDDKGKQVTEEIIVDGKKMTVPKWETRAERNLRITQEKKFQAKDVAEAGDGTTKPAKTVDEKLNEAAVKESEVTPSSAKLRLQQEEGIIRGALEAANKNASPAAKDALKKITKDYERGTITKERYLELLKDVPKISGEAVTKAQMEAAEYNSKAGRISKMQLEGQQRAALEKKYGKGFTTKAGEGGSTEYVPADVPKSELKGRKWTRDASGKLVLVKK